MRDPQGVRLAFMVAADRADDRFHILTETISAFMHKAHERVAVQVAFQTGALPIGVDQTRDPIVIQPEFEGIRSPGHPIWCAQRSGARTLRIRAQLKWSRGNANSGFGGRPQGYPIQRFRDPSRQQG
jgi:hypothetical protein